MAGLLSCDSCVSELLQRTVAGTVLADVFSQADLYEAFGVGRVLASQNFE
jgi:hypothetical protein